MNSTAAKCLNILFCRSGDGQLIDFLSVDDILNIRLVCKSLKNEIDHLPFQKRLKPWETTINGTLSLYENLDDLTFYDLKFLMQELIDNLTLYCCNWMGSVLKPRNQMNQKYFHNALQSSEFTQRSTEAIAIIDSIWSQIQKHKTFEEFFNFSFEHFVIVFLLLIASDPKVCWRVMKLKNCLMRELILLFTGYSSLKSRKEYEQDPFVITVYEPMTDIYHPSTKMFQIDSQDQSIDGVDLSKIVSYHQRQIMITLTSIFTLNENYKVFPRLKCVIKNLGIGFNVPCFIKQTKGIGLTNLNQQLKQLKQFKSTESTQI